MKNKNCYTLLSYFFGILWIHAQDGPSLKFTTVNQVSVKEGIDTLVIFDPATEMETVRIMKYKSINLDLNNCAQLGSEVSLGLIQLTSKQLAECSSLSIQCKPEGQIKDWSIQFFTLAIQKKGQELQKLTASDSHFNDAIVNALSTLEKGNTIYFENIILLLPGLPVVKLSFGVEVE